MRPVKASTVTRVNVSDLTKCDNKCLTSQKNEPPANCLEAEFDTFLKIAETQKFVGIDGLILKKTDQLKLPELDKEQLEFIKKILKSEIIAISRNGKLPEMPIKPEMLLGKLRSALLNKDFKMDDWYLIGGAIRSLFNPSYLKKIWSDILKLKNSGNHIKTIKELLPDFDFSCHLEAKTAESVGKIFNEVIETVLSMHQEKNNDISFADVQRDGFQNITPVSDRERFVIAKLGDGRTSNVEVKLYDNLRPCLFTVDAWKINLADDNPHLICTLPGWEWQSLVDITARLIRASDPKSINDMGWPRMCTLITDGYRCPDLDLPGILWNNMIKGIPPCNIFIHLKKCFFNHYPETGINAKVYFLNISIHMFMQGNCHDALENIWYSKDNEILSPAIQNFLKNNNYNFKNVLLMLQLVAFALYFLGDKNASLTKHQNNVFFQIKINNSLKDAYLLIPFNPELFKELDQHLKSASSTHRKLFVDTLQNIYEEFNLKMLPLKNKQPIRISKLNNLGCTYSPLFDTLQRIEHLSNAKLLFQLLLIRKTTALEKILVEVPVVLSSMNNLDEQQEFCRWLNDTLSIDVDIIRHKLPVDEKNIENISILWLQSLITTKSFVSANSLWRTLLAKMPPQNLSSITKRLVIDASASYFPLAIMIIKEALRRDVWQNDSLSVIKTTLKMLQHKFNFTENKTVAILMTKPLIDIFVSAFEKYGKTDPDLSAETVKNILWLIQTLFEFNHIRTANKLFLLLFKRPTTHHPNIAWEIWQNYILKGFVKKRSPFSTISYPLYNILTALRSPYGKLKPDNWENFKEYIQAGIDSRDLLSIRIIQLCIEKNLIPNNETLLNGELFNFKIDYKKLTAAGIKIIFKEIIASLISTGELKKALFFLQSAPELKSTFEKDIFLKKLALNEFPNPISEIIQTYRQNIISATTRDNLFLKVVSKLNHAQAVAAYKEYQEFLPDLPELPPAFSEFILNVLHIISNREHFDGELFIKLYERYPKEVSLDILQAFIYSSINRKCVNLGWQVLEKAPKSFFSDIKLNFKWIEFFQSSAINYPEFALLYKKRFKSLLESKKLELYSYVALIQLERNKKYREEALKLKKGIKLAPPGSFTKVYFQNFQNIINHFESKNDLNSFLIECELVLTKLQFYVNPKYKPCFMPKNYPSKDLNKLITKSINLKDVTEENTLIAESIQKVIDEAKLCSISGINDKLIGQLENAYPAKREKPDLDRKIDTIRYKTLANSKSGTLNNLCKYSISFLTGAGLTYLMIYSFGSLNAVNY